MGIPNLNHLQFAVICLISKTNLNGTDLKKSLESKFSHNSTSPAFYQLMGRMEDEELVQGRYHRVDSDGIHKRWKIYSLTEKGRTEAQRVIDFYKSFVK